MLLTTKQWAELHGVTVLKVHGWITNGHIATIREGKHYLIRADHPMPDPNPPEGYVTIPEYACVHGVPKHVLNDLVKRGVIPVKKSTSCSKRWISLDLKLQRDTNGWRIAS